MCMSQPGKWFTVPVGASREDAAPYQLQTDVRCEYQQGDLEYCLVYCLASALFYMGFHLEAKRLSALAEDSSLMDRRSSLDSLLAHLEVVFPSLAGYESFGSLKKRKKKPISLEDICENHSVFPTIVIPLGNDNSLNHAVCVIDDLIFDSTQKVALKLKKESFDWICGEDGVHKIDGAIQFTRKTDKNAPTVERTLKTNW